MGKSRAKHFPEQRNKWQSLDPRGEIQGGRKREMDGLLHIPPEDANNPTSVKSWGVVNTRFNMASRFLGESCVGTQSQQLLYTDDTVPDDDPI